MWKKLLANNINVTCFRIIFNIYKGIKSCVLYNGEQSSFSSSFRGVRPGKSLSPVLVPLFLNYLEKFLSVKKCYGVKFEFQYDDITLYLKVFVYFYADETIVFGTDEKEFQNQRTNGPEILNKYG